jgi:hypothetical protein
MSNSSANNLIKIGHATSLEHTIADEEPKGLKTSLIQ